MTTTDLEVRTPERALSAHTGEPAYKQFSGEMIALIGKAIMPERHQPHELYFILELAATYGLDPFTREIQAIRWTRNAEGSVQAVVGRDGLLAIAQRHPDYLGFRCAAVYANDEFEVTPEPAEWKLPDGRAVYTKFRHTFKGFDRNDRGELVGAFAEVYREGKVPTDFMAYLPDYDQGSKSDKSPWLKMKDVMIEKVALVTALRLAFRIGGLYIREELSGVMLAPDGQRVQPPGEEEPDYGDDPVVAEHLRRLFDHLGSRYLPAKRRLLLRDLDEAGRADLVARLEREILEEGGEPPARPDPEEVAEVVADADVVVEGAEDVPFGEDEQGKLA